MDKPQPPPALTWPKPIKMSDGTEQYHLTKEQALAVFQTLFQLRTYIEAQLKKCEAGNAGAP